MGPFTVIAGLVPAISIRRCRTAKRGLRKGRVQLIGIAGTSPAMTVGAAGMLPDLFRCK
jgi:hypothetical protein